VKCARSLDGHAGRGLRALEELIGDRLVRGLILHLGPDIVPFSRRIHAIPLAELWSGVPVES
jgi:hypothetical protein